MVRTSGCRAGQTPFSWDQTLKLPFLRRIYALTGGNPFFVEEVASALVTSANIFYHDDRWQLKPSSQLHIPHSLRLIVQQHTDHLSAAAADLLDLEHGYDRIQPPRF